MSACGGGNTWYCPLRGLGGGGEWFSKQLFLGTVDKCRLVMIKRDQGLTIKVFILNGLIRMALYEMCCKVLGSIYEPSISTLQNLTALCAF